MKSGVFLILSVSWLVACAEKRVSPAPTHWVIEEADPDIKMEIDDQFLKKSQKLSREERAKSERRKTFLNP